MIPLNLRLLVLHMSGTEQGLGFAYVVETISGLLKGGNAGLGNVDIIFRGAASSDRANTPAVNHDRKAAGNGDKRTWPCRQSDGDGVMIIPLVSAWTLFSRRETRERGAASFG